MVDLTELCKVPNTRYTVHTYRGGVTRYNLLRATSQKYNSILLLQMEERAQRYKKSRAVCPGLNFKFDCGLFFLRFDIFISVP